MRRRQWTAVGVSTLAVAGVAALIVGVADTRPDGEHRALPVPTASSMPATAASDPVGPVSSSTVTSTPPPAPASTATVPPSATRTASATTAGTVAVPPTTAATAAAPRPAGQSNAAPAAASGRPPQPAGQAAPVSPAPPPQPPAQQPVTVTGQALPLSYGTGSATQVVTVTAAPGSSYAKVSWWNKAPGGGWLRAGGPVDARVGSDGMSWNASEFWSATPMGSFTLTQAFGWAANPGTSMPFIHTDSGSWWVSENHDGLYNTYQHCFSNCPFTFGDPNEHLSAIGVYRYALVIDYNRSPAVYPRGSAFFFHVMNSQATAGCVSTDVGSLTSILRWLQPNAAPRILIGTV